MCKVILGEGRAPLLLLQRSAVKFRIQQLSSRVDSSAYLLRDPRQVTDGICWQKKEQLKCPLEAQKDIHQLHGNWIIELQVVFIFFYLLFYI